MSIITTLEKLQKPAEPLQFLTDKGIEKEEGEAIIKQLKDVLEADKTLVALAAPQIGIDKRIFCMRFKDTIKTFINPIVTKKSQYVIQPEVFSSMPGKEILITRPEDITVVYYADEFKYEENKLLGIAARVFDQSCQLLDGITPDVLGLVSDVEKDGTLWDLNDEEMKQVIEIYKQYIDTKTKALEAQIKTDPELESKYKELQFTEKVINGHASIVGRDVSPKAKAAESISIKRAERANQQVKAANRARLVQVINKSRKHKNKRK